MSRQSPRDPSPGWRNEIFDSPPRIDVEKVGKATTGSEVPMGWRLGELAYANGGYERTAMLLLESLWAIDVVKRWKSQPLDLTEIGGPRTVPDLLIELRSGSLHVVECKAKRFLTEEVKAAFELDEEFLKERGIAHHVWTNRDVLTADLSYLVSELLRGRISPAPKALQLEIAQAAATAECIGELAERFGWDDTISTAAHGHFHFNLLESLDEQTRISLHPAKDYESRLFARRHADASWWGKLRPA
ncbi:MAG: hypothetical protein GXD23_13150 [Comamonadaceae bacterium]|jgi:hypothetical protein|nr:hypothetical protein [Comamonadaceae bacterium]